MIGKPNDNTPHTEEKVGRKKHSKLMKKVYERNNRIRREIKTKNERKVDRMLQK